MHVLFQRYKAHNVIIGKSYSGHLEFMQIRLLVLTSPVPPPKNIGKCILSDPFAEFQNLHQDLKSKNSSWTNIPGQRRRC